MEQRIFLSPPWFGDPERAAVAAAFDSGYIAPCGPMVDQFDQRLGDLAQRSAAAVVSGTAALDLIMAELALGTDDIVVASSLTFMATVGPARHRGAQLVFVDSDAATGTLSLPLLEDALRDVRRKHVGRLVVIAADIYGQCCDYDALEAVCSQYDATLIIDAAESVGATWRGRPAGKAGFMSAYSFNGNKIITTSGGGAVLSDDAGRIARARWRAQQAREPVVWYEHREVGYNYRMSNVLAAIGCAQLDRLPEILRRKRQTFAFYHELFGGRAVPFPCACEAESSHWLSVFVFPSETARDAAAAKLTAANIESRPVWKPLHLQPVFRTCRVYGGAVGEDLFARGLCLPSGAGLTATDYARIHAALA